MKIIVHPGFHKTGTTSLQQTLRANRKLLAPDVRIILRPGMKALCQAARGWSASGDALDLGLVKYEASMLGEALQTETARTVILSSENLCGHLPGRKGIKTYAAAPKLMQSVVLGLYTSLPEASVTFFLTTRSAEDWLQSCHAQHLAAIRMRLSLKDYIRKYSASAALDLVVDDIAKSVPDNSVYRAALEDHAADKLGVAAALFDLLDLPADTRAMLRPSPPANVGPRSDQCEELLSINQSDLPDADVRRAKRAVLKGAA